ncbi:MAG: hypothetical protein ACP5HX_11520, partial [Thermoproteota archaeon]
MLHVEEILSRLSVILVSHIAFAGHSQELEKFLQKRCRKLVFIGIHFLCSTKNSFATVYENGNVKSKLKAPVVKGSEFILYIKDFLLTFY